MFKLSHKYFPERYKTWPGLKAAYRYYLLDCVGIILFKWCGTTLLLVMFRSVNAQFECAHKRGLCPLTWDDVGVFWLIFTAAYLFTWLVLPLWSVLCHYRANKNYQNQGRP